MARRFEVEGQYSTQYSQYLILNTQGTCEIRWKVLRIERLFVFSGIVHDWETVSRECVCEE